MSPPHMRRPECRRRPGSFDDSCYPARPASWRRRSDGAPDPGAPDARDMFRPSRTRRRGPPGRQERTATPRPWFFGMVTILFLAGPFPHQPIPGPAGPCLRAISLLRQQSQQPTDAAVSSNARQPRQHAPAERSRASTASAAWLSPASARTASHPTATTTCRSRRRHCRLDRVPRNAPLLPEGSFPCRRPHGTPGREPDLRPRAWT